MNKIEELLYCNEQIAKYKQRESELRKELLEELKNRGGEVLANGRSISIKKTSRYSISDFTSLLNTVWEIEAMTSTNLNLIREKHEPNMANINKMPDWIKDKLMASIEVKESESLDIKEV